MGVTKAPEDLLRKIRQGNRFLLVSHVNPDGDAIGSELGLARLLRRLGKGAVVWNHDPTPSLYLPLPGSDRIHVGEEPPAGYRFANDASTATSPEQWATAAFAPPVRVLIRGDRLVPRSADG